MRIKLWLLLILVVLTGCEREYPFEGRLKTGNTFYSDFYVHEPEPGLRGMAWTPTGPSFSLPAGTRVRVHSCLGALRPEERCVLVAVYSSGRAKRVYGIGARSVDIQGPVENYPQHHREGSDVRPITLLWVQQSAVVGDLLLNPGYMYAVESGRDGNLIYDQNGNSHALGSTSPYTLGETVSGHYDYANELLSPPPREDGYYQLLQSIENDFIGWMLRIVGFFLAPVAVLWLLGSSLIRFPTRWTRWILVGTPLVILALAGLVYYDVEYLAEQVRTLDLVSDFTSSHPADQTAPFAAFDWRWRAYDLPMSAVRVTTAADAAFVLLKALWVALLIPIGILLWRTFHYFRLPNYARRHIRRDGSIDVEAAARDAPDAALVAIPPAWQSENYERRADRATARATGDSSAPKSPITPSSTSKARDARAAASAYSSYLAYVRAVGDLSDRRAYERVLKRS